jgi:DNA-directed RNA polymerase subunit E'/Rpb7
MIKNNNETDENNIYFNNVLIKRLCIKSKYLNQNIDNYIFNYLKSNIEGKCIDEGYVEENSIKVIKKSVGLILGSRFTGDVTYDIIYTANVCNPVNGNIITCKVKFINKLGILATNGPITITIPKQLHNDVDFEHIQIGDNIKIEVIAKKFSLNQKEIKIVARIFNDTKKNKNITIKKKEELISSDLTPILQDNDIDENIGEETNFSDNEDDDEELSIGDTELFDDSDEELISDNEIDDNIETTKIKMENPDENNLDLDDIEIDEDDIDDIEEEEDEESSIDYD